MKGYKKILSIIITTILVIFLSSCSISSSKSNPTKPAQNKIKLIEKDLLVDEYVKWEGRYEKKEIDDKEMVMIYHTATGFTIDFYGTKLQTTFYHKASENGGSNIYYNVAVDDELLPNPIDGRTICLEDDSIILNKTIVDNLDEGRHRVTCLKMSEPADSTTGIINFSTDGYFYKRDIDEDNSKLKMMFVCASGGSGFGSLVSTQGKNGIGRTRANSSSLHAFNYLLARMYDADVSFVAQAGWGLCFPKNKSILKVFDHVGILGDSTYPNLQNTVTGALTTSLWNHDNFVPDIIIFNIGGNDTKNSEFDVRTYKEGVVEIVSKLHRLYPNAKMLWTHTDSKCGNYAMSALSDEGITNQGYIKQAIIPQVGDDGTYGASSHNSFKTHIDTAKILSTYLETYGFTQVRDNIKIEDFNSVIINN